MDQNGDNISNPDNRFSYWWLLFGADWYRWDTFPAIGGDLTVEINHDAPTTDSAPMTFTRDEMVREWIQSQSNEHEYYESPPLEEDLEIIFNEDTFAYQELLDLTEQIGDVSIGLTVETIDEKLKPRKYEDCCEEMEKCVICQDNLKCNEEASKLGCGHDFHFECIKEWLMVKNECPLCKRKAL